MSEFEYEVNENDEVVSIRPSSCPTCESTDPRFHPVRGVHNQVIFLCPDEWHDQ